MTQLLTSAKAYLVATAIVALAAGMVAPFASVAWRRFRRQGLAFSLVALGFLYAAATKPSKFTFESGLTNNGSYSTNSTVHVAWRLASLIPSNTTVYVEYMSRSVTNDVWHSLGSTTVGSLLWETENFTNATNYNYNIWYYYIPPQPVHTNGVWEYRTMPSRDPRFALPLRATVEADGMILSTPKQKKAAENE